MWREEAWERDRLCLICCERVNEEGFNEMGRRSANDHMSGITLVSYHLQQQASIKKTQRTNTQHPAQPPVAHLITLSSGGVVHFHFYSFSSFVSSTRIVIL